MQRPRLPIWLVDALNGDRWLVRLAIEIVVWVGNPTTAGTEIWPVESWTGLRAQITGEWSDTTQRVHNDIDAVLDAMRRRPAWYAAYVERPLGRKQPPLTRSAPDDDHAKPLALVDQAELDDATMREQAYAAVLAIRSGLHRGEPAETVVSTVLAACFEPDPRSLVAELPNTVHYSDRLLTLLHDGTQRERLVTSVLAVVDGAPDPRS